MLYNETPTASLPLILILIRIKIFGNSFFDLLALPRSISLDALFPVGSESTFNLPSLILHSSSPQSTSLKMAFKRRWLDSDASSRQQSSSSRPQSFSRLSSVPRSIPPSSPSLPAHPPKKRISLRPPNSQVASTVSSRDEDIGRAPVFEEDAETELREESDAVNEVMMAIDMRDHGTIGCAYYVAGLDVVETLKLHAQPTAILIGTRSDEKLEDHLSKEARGIDRGDEASRFD
jgi:hypothetical protein